MSLIDFANLSSNPYFMKNPIRKENFQNAEKSNH